jgi:hypothetical protein
VKNLKALSLVISVFFLLQPAVQAQGNTQAHSSGRSLQGIMAPVPAPIKYQAPAAANSGPAIICRVPVQTVGPLTFNNNVVLIEGDTIEVRSATDSSGLTPPALRGLVIRHDAPNPVGNGEREMTGLAFFNDGKLLLELGNRAGEDMLFRNAGGLTGDIVGIGDGMVLFRQRDGRTVQIPLASINYLRSPRAFLFTLTGRPTRMNGNLRTQIEAISFRPTSTEDLSESIPTSVIPQAHADPDSLAEEEEPSGFAVTSPMSGYQPALGRPAFGNQFPAGMHQRRQLQNTNWP